MGVCRRVAPCFRRTPTQLPTAITLITITSNLCPEFLTAQGEAGSKHADMKEPRFRAEGGRGGWRSRSIPSARRSCWWGATRPGRAKRFYKGLIAMVDTRFSEPSARLKDD